MSPEPKILIFEESKDFVSYSAGTVIFKQGDHGNAMYVVKTGEVEIKIGDQVIQSHGPGHLFGEMALIDNAPRSADAVAKTDCDLVAIDESRFLFLVQHSAFFALQVMRIMADRLRSKLPQA